MNPMQIMAMLQNSGNPNVNREGYLNQSQIARKAP